MRGGNGVLGGPPPATAELRSSASVFRSRSTLEATVPAARVYTGVQTQPFHEVGHVTSERVARLCGDHLEHCYEAQRLTTYGTTCISVAYHTAGPAAAGQPTTAGPPCSKAAEQQLVVCSTSSNSIALFNTATSACIAQHTKGPKRCSNAFTPSLSHVAVYGDPTAPAIELQLCSAGKFAFLEGHTVEVRSVDLTPDGSTIISGGRAGQVFVWQVCPQQQQPGLFGAGGDVQVLRHTLQGHLATTQVKACCLSAAGRWAATGSSDGKVLLWDLCALTDAEAVAASCIPLMAAASGGASQRSSSCCTAAPAGLVQLAAEWQLGQVGREQISCLTLAANGSVLAVGTRTGKVHVVLASNTDGRQLVQLPVRHSEGYKVRCTALSPDASKLLTSADDARLVLWDLSTRSCMLSIHEHTKPIRGCCWSPDGRHICSVGDDNLLCLHDVMVLSSSCSGSGSKGSKLRMAARLDGLAGATAATAAAEAEAAGEGPSSSTVLQHPGLKRMDVSMLKERLLACVPLPAPPQRSSCTDSYGGRPVKQASSAAEPAADAANAAAPAMQDGVLCADQSGQLLLLPPDSTAAVPTGMSVGSSIACCCFVGGVIAAAKRDGAVTVMSCCPGTNTTATPASGVSTTAAGSAPSELPAAAGIWSTGAAAAMSGHIAVSAKIDMIILGISVCRTLGRVALAGVERKNTQTGIVYLWEFDPSVRPAALKAQGTLRGFSSVDILGRQHSNRSMLSSRESADDSVTSPNWVSIDFDVALQQGKGAASIWESQARRAQGKEANGSPSAAAAAKRRSSGDQARVSSSVDAAAGMSAPVPPTVAGASGSNWGSPQGWLWHSDNPAKVLSCQEAPMLCCAWTKGADLPKLVAGSAAGWVVVVNCQGEELEDSMSRYQIHSCDVSAVDCAADGATVVSGGSDGNIVLWSHVTGFKLAVFTLHTAAIRSLAFSQDGTLLAAGDTDGVVSAWDVPQSCLLSAAQAHEGYISGCCWSSGSSTNYTTMHTTSSGGSSSITPGNGSRQLSVISCGYDGALCILQVDPGIYRTYCAAFCGLYHTCKKNNKLHKLETALNWHLQHGALQDASVLQLLVVQAAADGNVAMLSLLLPLFEKMGWLLHFGPIFARPTMAVLQGAAVRKTDSNNSLMASASKHERRHRHSLEQIPQSAHASVLQAYQPNLAPSAAVAAVNGIGLGLDDYVIHPHDRAKLPSSSSRGSSHSPARRSTADRLLAERGHKRSGSYGDGPAGFLDGAVVSTPRNSRWAHSVADIKTMLAFSAAQQQSHQHAGGKEHGRQQQKQPVQLQSSKQPLMQQLPPAASGKAAEVVQGGGPAALLAFTAGRSSFNGSSAVQISDAAGLSDPGSTTFASLHRSGSGGLDSDTSGGMYSPSLGPDSPRSTQSPTLTPSRLLSPSVSRNARMAAQLPMLDTLHEESYSRAYSTEERSPAAASRCSTLSLAAAAAALTAGVAAGRTTADSLPDSGSNSPRQAMFLPVSPRLTAADAFDANGDVRMSRGSDSITMTPPPASIGYSPSPSPNGFLSHLLRSARASQQQQDGSPLGGDVVQQPHGSPLQRQGSGSHLPPLPQQFSQQQQQQQQALVQEDHLQPSHQNPLARQVAALVSSRWLTRRWTSQDRSERTSGAEAGIGPHSTPLPALSSTDPHASDPGQGHSSSSETSPQAVATVTAVAGPYAFTTSTSSAEQGDAASAAAGGGASLPTHSIRCDPPSKQNSAKAFVLRLASSISRMSSRGPTADAAPDPAAIRAAAAAGGLDFGQVQSAFSAVSGNSRFDGLAASKRRLLASWASWRDAGKSGNRGRQQHVQPQLLQRPPATHKRLSGAASQRADLLQVAMASQQAQCVRLVADALLEGRFSKVSVVLHMYEALQALIHDPQHKRTCRRLLKHLPMIDNGEVEVDSLLVHNTKIMYKCSAHGHTGNLWSDAMSSHEALLDALDVLVKHSSWRDSIVALLIWPVLWSLRHIGASWLWLWRRQGLRLRHRVQVSAASKLVPVAHAAEIRSSSKGNLLRQLLSANVDADLYGKELVRAVINVKWESFARAFLLMQFVQFLAYFVLFLAYMSVAVYGNDPAWTTSELVAYPQGRAALALECILMIMMFGQAADEAKQMVTYKQDYFNSPWNYFDCASIVIISMLFLLHISRLNHQLFIILVALELLLLCLRALYFCMAAEKVGALLRMVLIVIKDMRYFFLMLVFLLVSFGLTFSVLMSPATTSKVNLVSLVGTAPGTEGAVAGSELQVFGSLEDSILQLFTIMFGDIQFSTLKTILSVNTVASRLAVFMAAIYAVLVLIVLVNLLIAIVDETYGVVKESEADQILRNKALIIDEIESTLTDAVIQDLNSRVLLPYVHILIPQAARPDQQHRRRDLHTKFRKLKQFIKQSLQEQAATSSKAATAAAAAAAAATAAAAAAAAAGQKWPAAGTYSQHGQQDAGCCSHGVSNDGAVTGSRTAGAAAAGAAGGSPRTTAAAAAAGTSVVEAPPRPHQLRPNSLSGPGGWASLRRHSMSGQQQQQQQQEEQQGLAAGLPAAAGLRLSQQGDAAVLAMAAGQLQQEVQQLSSTVVRINQEVESVASSSAAAVAGLSGKLDSLQNDVGQMKQLLMALLERQQ